MQIKFYCAAIINSTTAILDCESRCLHLSCDFVILLSPGLWSLLNITLLTQFCKIHFFSIRVDQASDFLVVFLCEDQCWCEVLWVFRVHLSNTQLRRQ